MLAVKPTQWPSYLAYLVSFATMPQAVLLPVFAADVLGGGPHTLGLLSAASGLGALAGALYLASRPSVVGLGRVIVLATVVLGLFGFSQSGSLWLSAALLVATGAGMMVEMAASNTLIQTMVDEDKRGRVMGGLRLSFSRGSYGFLRRAAALAATPRAGRDSRGRTASRRPPP